MPKKSPEAIRRVSVYLTVRQIQGLEELYEATKVPTATRIREGVDLVLAQYRGKRPTKGGRR
jgi:Ribbon-helix-helix domain